MCPATLKILIIVPPLLLHYRQSSLQAGYGPEKVGVESLADGGHIHAGDGVQQSMPGVIDPHVDALVVVQRQADHAVNLFAITDVTGKRQGALAMADAGAGRFGASSVAGEQYHARTLFGKNPGNRLADAHRRSRDNHDFSGKICLA